MMDADYYEILGVARNATPEEIKKAWRKLCQKHHPDAGGDSAMQRAINEAYEVLSDEKRRAMFDKYGDPDFDLDKIAKAKICSLFNDLLDVDQELDDLPAACVEAIDRKIEEARHALEQAMIRLRSYQCRGQYMKLKSRDGVDLFTLVRETKEAQMRQRIREMERFILIEKRVREMVLDYEDVRPKTLPGKMRPRPRRRGESIEAWLQEIQGRPSQRGFGFVGGEG